MFNLFVNNVYRYKHFYGSNLFIIVKICEIILLNYN